MAQTDFNSLKKNRTSTLDKLNSQLEKISTKSYSDPNAGKFWKPTKDKAGNGFAVIRFLPASSGEEMPFVRVWDHGFQGPTGLWYIENSLTTLNQDDPVSEFNSKLWNSGVESDKEVARKQKRRLKYTANIYIVKDPGNPDNDGKVFMYQFGKKIFDKLNDQMNPSFEDEKAINPFDLWEGANFRLKIRKFEGYPNYDKSEFDPASPLLEDDDALEGVWKQQHALQELVSESNFKSYTDLKTKLYRVLDLQADAPVASAPAFAEADSALDLSSGFADDTPSPAPTAEASVGATDDGDDDLAMFKELARG
jgi:hypothetical protein|tara:strand:- start:346 stop:1272 length:927 start_codon:yes stop_codon:yes gene_type:complete